MAKDAVADAAFVPISTLLDSIEAAHVTPRFESALSARLTSLVDFARPTKSPSAASKRAVESGSVEVNGQKIEVAAKEREQAIAASQRLNIDEIDAVVLLRSFRLSRDEPLSEVSDATPALWDELLVFYFNERLSVLQLVQSVLNNGPSLRLLLLTHAAMHETPSALVSVATAQLLEKVPASSIVEIMAAFERRATEPLPDGVVRSGQRQAAFWAKQAVKEQLVLLQIAFLVLFSRVMPDSAALLAVFSAADKTAWAAHHERAASFDTEARSILREVEAMLIVISLEVLHLEVAHELTPPGPDDPELATHELLHPAQLLKIHEAIVSQAARFPTQSAPAVLGWASIARRLAEAMAERGSPRSYADIAARLQSGNGHEALARHALDGHTAVFATIQRVLADPVTSGPLGSGCLEIVRGAIDAAAFLCPPSYLPRAQYTGLLATFGQVYAHSSMDEARARFWATPDRERDERLQIEHHILETAVSRYPAESNDLLHLLRSLVGSADDLHDRDEAAGHREVVAQSAYAAFDALPVLTHVLPTGSSFAPWSAAIADPTVITANRSFAISRLVSIPEGAVGRLVTPISASPAVVSWDLSSTGGWSGWALLGDMLQEYAGTGRKATADPFGDSTATFWRSANLAVDVAAALELIRSLLAHDPALFRPLCGRLIGPDLEPAEMTSRVIAVLRQAIAQSHLGVAAAAIAIIAQLLPHYPGAIWIQLGDPSLLFGTPSSQRSRSKATGGATLLRADQMSGTYASTLAVLDLVDALFDDAQATPVGQDPAIDAIRSEVVARALACTCDDIWLHFSTWRYSDVRERYEIGRRITDIYAKTLAEITTSATSYPSRAGSSELVQALLVRPTQALLAPLLSALGDGPSSISSFTLAGHVAEALAAERYFYSSLELALRLLTARRQVIGASPSLLERRLLSSPDTLPTLLHAAIHRSATDEESQALSISAARVVAALSVLTTDWPATAQAPSILSHLGSAEDAQAFVSDLLALAGSEEQDVNRRSALWDLMSAIVSSQPGFAVLIVSGETVLQRKKDGERPNNAVKTAQQALAALTGEDGDEPAELLLAITRFLDVVWSKIVDHATALQKVREDKAFWTVLVDLALRTELGDCSEAVRRTLVKSHAVNAIAAELRFAVKSGACATALLAALKSADRIKSAIVQAVTNSLDATLQERIIAQLGIDFPSFDLAQCARPTADDLALDVDRVSSGGPRYPPIIVHRRLERCGDQHLEEAVLSIDAVNANLAICEAQLAATRSWRALLNAAGPAIRADDAVARGLFAVAIPAIGVIATPQRAIDAVSVIHAERLSLLLALLEAGCGLGSTGKRDETELVRLLDGLRRLVVKEDLDPISSVRRLSPSASPFHRQLFSCLYVVLSRVNATIGIRPLGLSKTAPSITTHALDDIARVTIEACSIVFRASPGLSEVDRIQTELDGRLISAALLEAVRSSGCPPPSVWLAHALRNDLITSLLQPVANMAGGFASQALSLLISLAESSLVAERIAYSGAIAVLTGNELTPVVEVGQLTPSQSGHSVWRLELTLATRLLSVIGSPLEDEVANFAQASLAQLARPLRWTMNDALPIALLDEMEAVVSLMHALALPQQRSATVHAALLPLVTDSLVLLNELVYAVQHPNKLIDQIDPEPEERAWADSESDTAASSDLGVLGARPVTGPVLQTVLGIISTIVSTLVCFTRATKPFSTLEMDWPLDMALVQPDSAVGQGRPACTGTLTELANFCSDAVTQLSATAPTPVETASPLPAFNREAVRSVATLTLENALLLATSQLALHLATPNVDTRTRRLIQTESSGEVLDAITKASRAMRPENTGSPVSMRRSVQQAEGPFLKALRSFVTSRLSAQS